MWCRFFFSFSLSLSWCFYVSYFYIRIYICGVPYMPNAVSIARTTVNSWKSCDLHLIFVMILKFIWVWRADAVTRARMHTIWCLKCSLDLLALFLPYKFYWLWCSILVVTFSSLGLFFLFVIIFDPFSWHNDFRNLLNIWIILCAAYTYIFNAIQIYIGIF